MIKVNRQLFGTIMKNYIKNRFPNIATYDLVGELFVIIFGVSNPCFSAYCRTSFSVVYFNRSIFFRNHNYE